MAAIEDALEGVYQQFLDRRRGITRQRNADVSHLQYWAPVSRMVPNEREGGMRLYFDMYGARFRRRGGYDDPIRDYLDFINITAKINGEAIDSRKSPKELQIRLQDTVVDLEVCKLVVCFVLFCFVFVLFCFSFVLFCFSFVFVCLAHLNHFWHHFYFRLLFYVLFCLYTRKYFNVFCCGLLICVASVTVRCGTTAVGRDG